MAACEAMAAGRTLIVAAGTGSGEVVGNPGIVVQRESPRALCAAMEKLWTDRPNLDRLSRAALERIRTEFSANRIAQRREQYYQNAIGNFAAHGRSEFTQKLESLPTKCAAAVLPAMVRLTKVMAIAANVPAIRRASAGGCFGSWTSSNSKAAGPPEWCSTARESTPPGCSRSGIAGKRGGIGSSASSTTIRGSRSRRSHL